MIKIIGRSEEDVKKRIEDSIAKGREEGREEDREEAGKRAFSYKEKCKRRKTGSKI